MVAAVIPFVGPVAKEADAEGPSTKTRRLACFAPMNPEETALSEGAG